MKPSAQLAYVVRFYYPSDDIARPMAPPVPLAPMPVMAMPQQSFNPAPMAPITSAPLPPYRVAAPAPPPSAVSQAPRQLSAAPVDPSLNLNYTYSGPDNIAPLKVFDNGKATFFRFQAYKGQKVPAISIPSKTGLALPVQARPVKQGYWAVPMVSKQFQMRYDGAGEIVTVYNEGS